MKARIPLITASLILCLYLGGMAHNLAAQILGKRKSKGANAFIKRERPKKPETSFKVDVNLVVIRASVTDRLNRYVTGLSREHFRVFEDKIEQSIVHFTQENAPVSVGIIFDISGSMKEHFTSAKKSLVHFLENGSPKDEFFLVSFNHKVVLEAGFTNQSSNIQGIVAFRSPGGRTALYDAVYLGLEKVKEGRNDKKALIIISDGEDNSSRYSFGEVKELIKENDVQIYAVVEPGKLLYGTSILERLVQLTGGRAFFVHSFSGLDYYVRLIYEELRNQYIIGYHSTNKAQDGTWRKIKVRLNAPGEMPKLAVRAREGYYALKE